MTLKIGSTLLMLWGLTNAVGGLVGTRQHPASWVGALFVLVGMLITVGGVAFWLKKS